MMILLMVEYLYNYELFLENKLIDISSINGDSDILLKFKEYQNKNFIIDVNLKKYVTLKKRINNKKIRFEIKYNHNNKHNIIERIEDRTNLKSILEFNDKIEYVINELFPDKIDKDINVNGTYSIYLKNSNYTFIFKINYDNIKKETYKIYLKTIISGLSNMGYIIEIND
jgi:hypothetical protein